MEFSFSVKEHIIIAVEEMIVAWFFIEMRIHFALKVGYSIFSFVHFPHPLFELSFFLVFRFSIHNNNEAVYFYKITVQIKSIEMQENHL